MSRAAGWQRPIGRSDHSQPASVRDEIESDLARHVSSTRTAALAWQGKPAGHKLTLLLLWEEEASGAGAQTRPLQTTSRSAGPDCNFSTAGAVSPRSARTSPLVASSRQVCGDAPLFSSFVDEVGLDVGRREWLPDVAPCGHGRRRSAPHRRHTSREGSAWCRGLHTELNPPSPSAPRICLSLLEFRGFWCPIA